ncbi:MAG: M28 family peptidase [Chthonomonadetes bacterium]|nr:M28 family peptidase [Chthonomonadetes bacterium]
MHLRRVLAFGLLFGWLLVSGCAPTAVQAERPAFDGKRAFADLEKQVSFGPRVPGTQAHLQCRDWLMTELEKSADRVELQTFTQVVNGKSLRLYNIFGIFNENAPRRIMLCAHWDTRPTADEELDPANRRKPILGANDGASGVAVLLELARQFKAKRPQVGVIIAFWDGEDYGPDVDTMLLGSRYFAKNMGKLRPTYGILLDMVGDKDLQIYKETNSVLAAPELVERVWRTAEQLGYRKYFPNAQKYTITDDHVPLIEAGVPCIDLIDFDYPYWHTLQDTVDQCSAQSLQIVGEVVAAVVYSEGESKP